MTEQQLEERRRKGRERMKRLREQGLERKPSPESRRRTWLKRTYGIAPEDYDKLLAEQDGKCAICGQPEAEEKYGVLAVDHDHATGLIRGLLCVRCNNGLGYFKDNLEVIRVALEYMEKHHG